MVNLKEIRLSLIFAIGISTLFPFLSYFIAEIWPFDSEVVLFLFGLPYFTELLFLETSILWLIPRIIIFIIFGIVNYYLYKKLFYRLEYPKTYFIISSIIFYYIAIFIIFPLIVKLLFRGL